MFSLMNEPDWVKISVKPFYGLPCPASSLQKKTTLYLDFFFFQKYTCCYPAFCYCNSTPERPQSVVTDSGVLGFCWGTTLWHGVHSRICSQPGFWERRAEVPIQSKDISLDVLISQFLPVRSPLEISTIFQTTKGCGPNLYYLHHVGA